MNKQVEERKKGGQWSIHRCMCGCSPLPKPQVQKVIIPDISLPSDPICITLGEESAVLELNLHATVACTD